MIGVTGYEFARRDDEQATRPVYFGTFVKKSDSSPKGKNFGVPMKRGWGMICGSQKYKGIEMENFT